MDSCRLAHESGRGFAGTSISFVKVVCWVSLRGCDLDPRIGMHVLGEVAVPPAKAMPNEDNVSQRRCGGKVSKQTVEWTNMRSKQILRIVGNQSRKL